MATHDFEYLLPCVMTSFKTGWCHFVKYIITMKGDIVVLWENNGQEAYDVRLWTLVLSPDISLFLFIS